MRCWLLVMFENFRFRNSRVNWIDVSLSMSWRSKSFPTVWTLIGFHSSVKSHVAFQGVFTQKLVLAYVTFNRIWNNKNSGCNKSTSMTFTLFYKIYICNGNLGSRPRNIVIHNQQSHLENQPFQEAIQNVVHNIFMVFEHFFSSRVLHVTFN